MAKRTKPQEYKEGQEAASGFKKGMASLLRVSKPEIVKLEKKAKR